MNQFFLQHIRFHASCTILFAEIVIDSSMPHFQQNICKDSINFLVESSFFPQLDRFQVLQKANGSLVPSVVLLPFHYEAIGTHRYTIFCRETENRPFPKKSFDPIHRLLQNRNSCFSNGEIDNPPCANLARPAIPFLRSLYLVTR